ncbi:MAG TPA: hypothetical protein VMR74_08730 [Gammaproteobacteria bacterium]|nr:hypothetical protein [Gammaproteobacteria bacterium]
MKLLWGRIAVAGVLCEILYFLYLQFVLGDVLAAYAVSGMIGVAVCLMLGGIWVGRSASRRPVLQGALVGVAAIVFYFLLIVAVAVVAPDLMEEAEQAELDVSLFLLNHGLKIVGGALGGYIGAMLAGKPDRISV